MADIGKPETELGLVADEAIKLVEQRLGEKGAEGGQVLVMLTEWGQFTPNSNVSMSGYGDTDEEVAMMLIERLLTAAENTAQRIGYPLRIIEAPGFVPGNLPCDCGHAWEQHADDHLHACELCECMTYRPISRSEARRREVEAGRAEAAAKADHANKSERKSQDFPTGAEPGHRFWVDQKHGIDACVNAASPLGVAVDGHPVVDNGPLDTPPNARYMSYRSRQGAENGLSRARLELPNAQIVEYEPDGG